jgi:hypothetical protein
MPNRQIRPRNGTAPSARPPASGRMAEVRFLGCDNDVFCANVQARATEFEQASGTSWPCGCWTTTSTTPTS